jgi:hypothetical protein
MSETKHTPGPWKWQDWGTYGDPDEGPQKNTLVGGSPKYESYGHKLPYPAYTSILSVEDPIENEADKQLIAAAPELLEAAMWMKGFLIGLENSTEPGDPLREIRKRVHAPLHEKLDAAMTKSGLRL